MRAIFVVLFALGCGTRTQLYVDPPRVLGDDGGRDAGMDGGDDAGIDGGRDAGMDGGRDAGMDGGRDAGRPFDAGACVFSDGLERGFGRWSRGTLWYEGTDESEHYLFGFWTDWDNGCPGTSMASMRSDVDLAGVDRPTLRWSQSGMICENDTLRVVVSIDGGRTWLPAGTPDDPSFGDWREQEIDLSRWAGRRVRVGFEFDNVCGDPCGVEWMIDDVSICAR